MEALAFSALGGLLWGAASRSVYVGLMTALLTMFGCRQLGAPGRRRYARWMLVLLVVGIVMLLLDRLVAPYLAAYPAGR